jgi:hypothetical protein
VERIKQVSPEAADELAAKVVQALEDPQGHIGFW